MHYQQEHFENAAQEHQRVVYEEVQIAAALATSRTAAQMTSRFRIMLKRTSISDRKDGRSNDRRRKSNSDALRLKFRIREVRWSRINLPKLETQKILEL